MPPAPAPRATVAIAFDRPRHRDAAEALAERLGLPLAHGLRDEHDLHLAFASPPDHGDRLELRVNKSDHPLAGGHAVSAEPHKLDTTSPAGRKLNAPLFKAVGVRKGDPFRPRVLDATTGLGEDAWLLAASGCAVVACERHPVVHALLEDGLRRASEVQPEIAHRITLLKADLTQIKKPDSPNAQVYSLLAGIDTVYLDPMFPPGRKTVEKKPMRVLRWLAGDDHDADALLPAAQTLNPHRVAVKRPRHAPALNGPTPSHTHDQGKALRFDVYVTPNP